MSSRQLRLASVAALAAFISACSANTDTPASAEEVPAAYTQLIAGGSVRFILSRAEQQVGDDIVLFDHMCTSGRISVSVRDTIVLNRDGLVSRSYNLRQSMAGTVTDSPNLMPGTWRLNPDWQRSRRAGVSLLYRSSTNAQFGEMEIWLVDANTLLLESSMGGSCPGSPKDGRNADMYYTRR